MALRVTLMVDTFRDSLLHLKAERYDSAAKERVVIQDGVKSHNKKVAEFVASNASIFATASSLGLEEINVSPMDSFPSTSEKFNRAAILSFLDDSFEAPSLVRLTTQVRFGGYFLLYYRGETPFTISHSLNENTMNELSTALSDFAASYLKARRNLVSDLASLTKSLTEFKSHAVSISHDVEDEEFDGICEFEVRIRQETAPKSYSI